MYSMTGYLQTCGSLGAFDCNVQIRSVNHRFLEIRTRLSPPADTPHVEQMISQTLRKSIRRGSLQVVVQLQRREHIPSSSGVNIGLCIEYGTAFLTLWRQCHELVAIQEPGSEAAQNAEALAMVSFIAGQKDVFIKTDMAGLSKEEEVALEHLVGKAVEQLLEERAREGAALAQALLAHLSEISSAVEEIRKVSKNAPQRRHRQLLEKLEIILPQGTLHLDPQRIAQEIAIIASHTDIDEELVRLDVHLAAMRNLCQKNEPVGKQLEFLIQEIHREINTLGSKSNLIEISQHLIHMKTHTERLREQVQNVE